MKRSATLRRRAPARRRPKSAELQAPPPVELGDVARCCTCGKPLSRLPASLDFSSQVGGFQCADCFYPGIGRTPRDSRPLSSDGGRWLSDLMDGSGDSSTGSLGD